MDKTKLFVESLFYFACTIAAIAYGIAAYNFIKWVLD